jgi:hypothetical protein
LVLLARRASVGPPPDPVGAALNAGQRISTSSKGAVWRFKRPDTSP